MRLKDNNLHPLSPEERENDLPNLKKISGKTIRCLLNENPGVLVFPQSFEKSEDALDKNEILRLTDENCHVRTGNVMGFIGIGETQLEISSRFESDCGNDFFLHYLLQKVFSLNLFSWNHKTSQSSALDLFALLFPYFLKKALQKGVYREYQTRERNDSNLRGNINFARHVRQNFPFAGKIAYRSREHDSENALSLLIRHTIEFLRKNFIFSRLLHFDKGTEDAVKQIVAGTPNFNPAHKDRVIAKNLRPRVHPFFLEYEHLQKICLKILRYDSLKYGNADEKISGILFDGAWLWEEYLATLPALKNFTHPKNKLGENGIRFFVQGNQKHYYPDFYDENCVFDAKYKNKNSPSEDRNDLFQIISYLHILKTSKGGFIVPATEEPHDIEKTCLELVGLGGELVVLRLGIPQNTQTYGDFCLKISDSENQLSLAINQFLESH